MTRKKKITRAEARAAARSLERVGKTLQHYFERYLESLSETGVEDQRGSLRDEIYYVDTLIGYLRMLENQAGSVDYVLSKRQGS